MQNSVCTQTRSASIKYRIFASMHKIVGISIIALLVTLLGWCRLGVLAADQKSEGKLPFDPANAKDITPDAFKGILKVYKTPEMNASMPTYVVRGSEYLSLGTSFGGDGVYSVIAADINGDGKKDLVYLYSWGSGLHRTNIGAVEVGAKLIDHQAADMLMDRDEDIKLLTGNGKITISVKDKPYADLVLRADKSGSKVLVLEKRNPAKADMTH